MKKVILVIVALLFLTIAKPVLGQFNVDWEVQSCTGAYLTSLFPGLNGTFEKPSNFDSSAIGENVGYTVYLPPSYTTNTTKRFPVVYYLHGSNGNECNYYGSGDSSARQSAYNMVNLIETGLIPETIFVTINGGRGLNYYSAVETMFINELIPDVDSRYRTIATREGRALEGFSMGGYGTAKFLFKYPQLFCTGTIMAGANIGNEMASFMWSNSSGIINNKLKVKGLVGTDQTRLDMDGLFGAGGDMDQFANQFGYSPKSDYITYANVGHNVRQLLDSDGLDNAKRYWSCFDSNSGGNPTATPNPTLPVTVTATQTPPLTVTPTSIPNKTGDLNGDGRVTAADYSLFLTVYGQQECGVKADLNNNCSVDLFDLNILIEILQS